VFRGTGQDNSETGPGTAWISQRESGFFYYSERAVRFTEEVVITFILLCISTLPVVALSLISGKTAKLITIVACVVVLAPLVSVFMPEKVQRSNLTLMLA
jgi:nitrate reductase NapE component